MSPRTRARTGGVGEDFLTRILPLRPLLFRQAWNLTHNAADAEDLVQETLLRAFTRYAQITNAETVAQWLTTMQRRIFLDCCRKRGRSPQTIASDDVLEEAAEAPLACVPERIVMSEFEHAALMQAIARLPKAYREVLVLCDIDDLSYQEIADRIGIPVGTVRSRLSRARARVRQAMVARNVF